MGITDPSEEYFKDGLWGWVAPAWKKLVAEAAGQLHVYLAGQAAAIEVTQTTPADLVAAAHGWDGAAWHKLPLLWGYSDRWAEVVIGVAAGAGDATALTVAVPPGYVYVAQVVAAHHNALAATTLGHYCYVGAVKYALIETALFAAGVRQPWTGSVVLKAGDQIAAVAYAPGAGKTVTLNVWGYKMRIAE